MWDSLSGIAIAQHVYQLSWWYMTIWQYNNMTLTMWQLEYNFRSWLFWKLLECQIDIVINDGILSLECLTRWYSFISKLETRKIYLTVQKHFVSAPQLHLIFLAISGTLAQTQVQKSSFTQVDRPTRWSIWYTDTMYAAMCYSSHSKFCLVRI